MIDYIDNFFNQFQYYEIAEYCLKAPYFFGETDNIDTPPTGMVSDIPEEEPIYKLFCDTLSIKIPRVNQLNLYALYINYFVPSENPYFHTDCEVGITCLYYLGPIKAMSQRWKNVDYNISDGGETQFIQNNNSINILPISNRMCFFDANILHRATPFRDKYRFTIAAKYR